jgi:AMP phosphorylase
MPVDLGENELKNVVRKTGACLVWGGGLNLAPADDILIRVEKSLRVQSFNKILMSIVAKKVAMGITHLLIDIPFGKDTKVQTPELADTYAQQFVDLSARFGIKCTVSKRNIIAPDGRGIGPILEARDLLWVLEQDDRRSLELERSTLDMTAQLLSVVTGDNHITALKIVTDVLRSGRALKKFLNIALAQGAKKVVKGDDLSPSELEMDIVSTKNGTIRFISRGEVLDIARAVGLPFVKENGIYFHKFIGDKVVKGDKLATFYASSREQLDAIEEVFDHDIMFDIR